MNKVETVPGQWHVNIMLEIRVMYGKVQFAVFRASLIFKFRFQDERSLTQCNTVKCIYGKTHSNKFYPKNKIE